MLKLIIGKAGTGKTDRIVSAIKSYVAARCPGNIYIVPEQYSHEAERELSRSCGDSLSLFAEVMSFTGFSRHVSNRLGGGRVKYLDAAGKLLCMSVTMDMLAGKEKRLSYFSYARSKSDCLSLLVDLADRFASYNIGPEKLSLAAENLSGILKLKLQDLALILRSYEGVVRAAGAESGDKLLNTARILKQSGEKLFNNLYIDGFTDFTAGEAELIRTLLLRGCDITLALTTDSLFPKCEAFKIPAATGRELQRFAEENGIAVELETIAAPATATPSAPLPRAEAISLLTDRLFEYTTASVPVDNSGVRLFSCPGAAAECELAAGEAIRLVRETGCRWRDIAVAIRGFDDYKPALRSIFHHYGVPLFMADSSDILSARLPSLITAAYEIGLNHWSCDYVISLLRTGLCGLDDECSDELENYVFLWQLDERSWYRAGRWSQNPRGYKGPLNDEDRETLERINASALKIFLPLSAFIKADREATTARAHARNLAKLFSDLDLNTRTAALLRSLPAGEGDSLRLIWNSTMLALEQCEAVLGDAEFTMREFADLFLLMLSNYEVNTIPASMDSVSAGDFTRMRRRSIRHLIVLGASSDRLPAPPGEQSIFSDSECSRLRELGIRFDAGDEELWREYSLIYSCLSLPSASLTLSCPITNIEGDQAAPSFVVDQAARLLGLEVKPYDLNLCRLNAEEPALSLAVNTLDTANPCTAAAAEYFSKNCPERMGSVISAARRERGSLSRAGALSLYGKNVKISASKTDAFANCRFGYFCQYGLKAEPYKPAAFSPAEIGTFMHDIFEHLGKRIKEGGGVASFSDADIRRITDECIEDYVARDLGGLMEKNSRFMYIFNRLRKNVHKISADLVEELRNSDFSPVDFELNFANPEDIPPFLVSEGDTTLKLTGIADRVDTMERDGKLYVRVVDYKTGHKEFKLYDIYNGVNMQMLLYLMALETNGTARYDRPLTPAGIVYFPARDEMAKVEDDSDSAIEEARTKNKKRSGLAVNDPNVVTCWDTGDVKRFTPFTFSKDKAPSGDSLVNAEQLDLLKCHIRHRLTEMSRGISDGDITADPYYASDSDNACGRCEFKQACGFADGENGECLRHRPRYRAKTVWELLKKEYAGPSTATQNTANEKED